MIIDETEVRRALERGEFAPHFQPLVILGSGKLAGFEVLARWNHPTRGVLLPDEFIPYAEKNEWIGSLTQCILRQAFSALPSWPSTLTLAVNISPIQLRDVSLPRQIRSAADQSGFPLKQLVVEITESALNHNLEHALIIAKEIKSMGCTLALDDFGTGYSSLLHLQSLPFDELKVDRSFVGSMTERRESRKIVGAVIGLGQNLGLKTVAEGVESEEQAELLRWLGCDQAQGWLYGKPIRADELEQFLATPMPSPPTTSAWRTPSLAHLNALPAQQFAQLQAVYDGAPVGLAFLNTHLCYVNLNQRLADMNGRPVLEHLSKAIADVLPEVFKQIEPVLHRALAGEGTSDFEITRHIAGSSELRTLLTSYEPVRDEAQEVIGVSVSVVDITERKRMEEALRDSQDHYRHMVELNPQIPWIMDTTGRNVELSPKWEAATGLSSEQSRGYGWRAALHPDDLEITLAVIEHALTTKCEIDVEYRVRPPGGNWRWMRARGSPLIDCNGTVLRWYGSVEDIDERKTAEEALRSGEARLRAVFESVPMGIILADAPAGTLRMANPEARRIFQDPIVPGPSAKDFSKWQAYRADGQPMSSECYPLARALRGETTHAEPLLCRFVDASEHWIALSGAPVRNPEGYIIGAVIVAQDLERENNERLRLMRIADESVHKQVTH